MHIGERWVTGLFLSSLGLAVLSGSNACARAPLLPDSRVELSTDSLIAIVGVLSADSMEGRGAGQPGEAKAATYLSARYRALGLVPGLGGRSYVDTFRIQLQKPVRPFEVATSRNVLAILPGDDPKVRDQIVVLGAHYDGQGKLGEADPGRMPDDSGETSDSIWNSANDNASGTAAVLEIARAFTQHRVRHRRSLLFVAFGAEEPGLAGSIRYVNQPPYPWIRHVAMLNVETIGRDPDHPLIAASTGTGTTWNRLLAKADSASKMKVPSAVDALIYDTDHYPFGARGVPAIVLGATDQSDSHQPDDEVRKFDRLTFARRANYVFRMVLELVNGDEVPVWVNVNGRDPGVFVGPLTPEELAARSLRPGTPALKVMATIAGMPGSRAGIQSGDLILGLNQGRFDLGRAAHLKNPLKDAADSTMDGRLVVDLLREGKPLHLEVATP